jgi:hypothetical protein
VARTKGKEALRSSESSLCRSPHRESRDKSSSGPRPPNTGTPQNCACDALFMFWGCSRESLAAAWVVEGSYPSESTNMRSRFTTRFRSYGLEMHTVAPSAWAVEKSLGIPVRVVRITGMRANFALRLTITHRS